jgi:hypothetical protein
VTLSRHTALVIQSSVIDPIASVPHRRQHIGQTDFSKPPYPSIYQRRNGAYTGAKKSGDDKFKTGYLE